MGKWSRRAFISGGIISGGAVLFGIAIRPGNRVAKVAPLISDTNDTIFNVWLKISPNNKITVVVPHAEMGQGAHTTLAMMLADELDADWNLVEVLEAPAHKEYANYALAKGYALGDLNFPSWLVDTIDGFFLTATQAINLQITGGSTAVRTTGKFAMRVAGASTKAVLLEAAASTWNVPTDELTTKNSIIQHTESSRSAPYSEFAAIAAQLKQPVKPNLKMPDEFQIMGTNVQRLDIPSKVDGSAKFGIDARPPSLKFAAIKTAPVFGTKLKSVDEVSIQNMPGVRKVIQLDNAVAVIADGYWQAENALAALKFVFEDDGNELVEQSDIFKQFENDMNNAIKNSAEITDFQKGDINAALESANHIVEAEYRVPYLSHAPMEPMNCTAWVHDDICEIWTGSQDPLGFAAQIADALEIDVGNVLLHNEFLGGAFGRRAFSDYAIQAAKIATEVPYPIQLIWSREEDMRHDYYRQASISRFEAALDNSGIPIAWINQYVEKHDPVEAPYIPYAIDNQHIHFTESKTHVPWGFWRSVDHSLHAFFTESFIDELAFAATKDPYAYRRDLLADSPRFLHALDTAAKKSNWDSPLPDNWGRGIAIHKSFGTIVAQVIEVEVLEGRVVPRRAICAVDAGFAMHPNGMEAQMESGIVYGLTAALYSEITIQHGAVAQSNFHDYPMLRINESPIIETYIINGGEQIGGGGEPGTPAVAPALVNAIFNATGKRIRQLPIRLHDLSTKELSSKDVA
ncbi:MAG: isoquinoline 1-oxidoreductase [Woeseia sp.]|nr:isoquinoline 1-oxidoreductase [Woeseia sp.]